MLPMEVNNSCFVMSPLYILLLAWSLILPLVYDLVVVFFPQMWTEVLLVYVEFVVFEKVMLAFESEVI